MSISENRIDLEGYIEELSSAKPVNKILLGDLNTRINFLNTKFKRYIEQKSYIRTFPSYTIFKVSKANYPVGGIDASKAAVLKTLSWE